MAFWLSFLSLAGAYVEPLQLSGLCGVFVGALLAGLVEGKTCPHQPLIPGVCRQDNQAA